MKKIKRTKDMSEWARFIATDKNGYVYTFTEKPSMYITGWGNGGESRIVHKIHYCNNWEKSLRRIINKPTRKDLKMQIVIKDEIIKNINTLQGTQKKEIEELNKIINSLEQRILKDYPLNTKISWIYEN